MHAPLTLFSSRTNVLLKEVMKLRGTRSRQIIKSLNDRGNILLRRTHSLPDILLDTDVEKDGEDQLDRSCEKMKKYYIR